MREQIEPTTKAMAEMKRTRRLVEKSDFLSIQLERCLNSHQKTKATRAINKNGM